MSDYTITLAEKAQLDAQNQILQQIEQSLAVKLQNNKVVDPAMTLQTIEPDNDNDAMRTVTISPITAEMVGARPELIVSGATVAGVQGTAASDISAFLEGSAAQAVTYDSLTVPLSTSWGSIFNGNALCTVIRLSNIKFINSYNSFLTYLNYIEAIYMPEALEAVGYDWFNNCPRLITLSAPKLQKLGRGSCLSSLALFEELILPSLISFGHASVSFPSVCDSCPRLTSIILPSLSLIGNRIGNDATNVNLKYLVIGTANCVLNNASYLSNYRTIGANIYFEDDYVDDYKTATNWSTYADIIKPISELPPDVYQKYLDAKAIAEEGEA